MVSSSSTVDGQESTLSQSSGRQYHGGKGWGSCHSPVPARAAVAQPTATLAQCNHTACCGEVLALKLGLRFRNEAKNKCLDQWVGGITVWIPNSAQVPSFQEPADKCVMIPLLLLGLQS